MHINHTSMLFLLLCALSTIMHATPKKPFIIGISGGVGSGKSTIVRKIQERYPESCSVVALDDYYKSTSHLSEEEKDHYNFDHPDAIDFPRLARDIETLRAGKSIKCPDFSFCNPTRPPGTMIHAKKIILVEGFLLFHDAQIRSLCDLMLFVDILDENERMHRLIKRNKIERNESVADSTRRYTSHIKPMHDAFIEPTRKYADMIIINQNSHDKALNVMNTFIEKITAKDNYATT